MKVSIEEDCVFVVLDSGTAYACYPDGTWKTKAASGQWRITNMVPQIVVTKCNTYLIDQLESTRNANRNYLA